MSPAKANTDIRNPVWNVATLERRHVAGLRGPNGLSRQHAGAPALLGNIRARRKVSRLTLIRSFILGTLRMAENCCSIELAAILCLLPPAVELHHRTSG